jgi:glycosyltransferase involved in cell wall biosynthesis
VPARNEEDLLPSALHALAEQRTADGMPLAHDTYEIILLINNSTDRTRHVARGFERLYPSLQLHVLEREFDNAHAHIGHVRRLLMDEACRRLEAIGRVEGLILSTDSDTRVASNWISRNAEEVARGAEAVGGRIIVLPCEQDAINSATQQAYRYDILYRRLICWTEDRCDPEPHDPWPKHHQHFGASLAITARAYRAAGRLPPRRYLEDVAFYDAMMRRDLRIRHSNLVRVFTSGRLSGRTRFGLSRQLRDWEGSPRRLLRMRVESARFLEQLFKTRRELRILWRQARRGQCRAALDPGLPAALGVTPGWIFDKARRTRYFGLLLEDISFYERFRRMWPDAVRLAKLLHVVEELETGFEADWRFRISRSSPAPALA